MKCRYYTSPLEQACKLGVDYRELAGAEPNAITGFINRLPCHGNSENPAKCHGYSPIVTAEMRAYEAAEMEKTAELLTLILPLRKRLLSEAKKHGWVRGFCECPKCDGDMDWSISQRNGHLSVKCRAEGCLSFME